MKQKQKIIVDPQGLSHRANKGIGLIIMRNLNLLNEIINSKTIVIKKRSKKLKQELTNDAIITEYEDLLKKMQA